MIIKKIKATILQISAFLICFLILINGVFAQQNKEVKVGILLGFTGNVESLTPSMADSAEMAFNEIASDMNLTNEIDTCSPYKFSLKSNIKTSTFKKSLDLPSGMVATIKHRHGGLKIKRF